MVLPPLPMEDQTDEDFFDNLVDGELDVGGCEPSLLNNVGNNDEQAFANLSIDEVSTELDGLDDVDRVKGDRSEKGGISDVVSCNLDDGKVEEFVAEGSGGGGFSGFPEAVDGECGDHVVEEKNESDLRICGNGTTSSVGSKEVQGGALNSGIQEAPDEDFFNQIGDNSADPFGEVADSFMGASGTLDGVSSNQATCSSSYNFGQDGENIQHASSMECSSEMQDQSSVQYWENLYPGWKYDPNTGQWYQVDGTGAIVNNIDESNGIVQSTGDGADANATSDLYHLQHTAQSVSGSTTEESSAGSLAYWNHATYGNTEYPANMVFDPQYPGWYYDTIALEWRSLDSYTSSIQQSSSFNQNQQLVYGSASAVNYYPEQNLIYGQGGQVNNYSAQLDQPVNWRDSGRDASNMAQHGMSKAFSSPENTQYGSGPILSGAVSYPLEHGTGAASYDKSFSYEQPIHGFDSSNGINRFQGLGAGGTGFQNFASAESPLQHNNHHNKFDQQFSAAGFNGPKVLNFTPHPLQNTRESYSSGGGRSSDGRPSHALVSFGFGGKLIVMKDHSSLLTQPAYANQDSAGGVISIHNVMEVAMLKNDSSDLGFGDCEYIRTLCQQSFSGPLVSGNVGSKELNKWIDDRIANCDSQDADYRKGEALKMLFSLLKIACQYYGKLRSAFGADPGSKEHDSPESALAKLFSSAKGNAAQFTADSHCLQNMPSEGQIQATAEEVQMLLVTGRRMEALQCAQKGHLWGPAIVIASLLGEQFYGETVKQMALHQLAAGSPLRTLCLLIAGQPAEVFSNSISSNSQNGANDSQSSLVGPGFMLDEWEENLAIISANRTKGDELVITHLGDCLWRERGEVMAAHICYLVSEANIESYSESSRLCLAGSDHLKYPRTYASPQAIQRTELYEYAKLLGNSQFVLLPFQPYKLIYACMLAEVGKLSDSLKYCQAVSKSLKTGRSPEVDAWRHMVSSLEERIKIHQQGGYATNFGRAKLVGKLLNFFDNTAHRVVGGLPPPTPSTSHNDGQHSEHDHQSRGPRVSTSQSTMAMSSLMRSASAEDSNHKSMHNRSMSEPDFGRTPRKDVSPKSSSSSPRDNSSLSGSSSRFGRIGSQIFQKTVGLVLRSRPDCQAKLGEKNKFYYDENLKRWVEEGIEPQAPQMTLAPPPTTTAFMDGTLDHNKEDESVNAMIHANGEPQYKHTNFNGKGAELPPIPSGSNHFSARGRMGVRARYVDTFNKGGGTPANSFQSPSPSVPAMRPAASNPTFFVPTPVTGGLETESTQSTQQTVGMDQDTTMSNGHHSFSPPQMLTPLSTIHRHPSMDKGMGSMVNGNGPLPPNSRRTLSWGGSLDSSNHSSMGEPRPPGEAPGFPVST